MKPERGAVRLLLLLEMVLLAAVIVFGIVRNLGAPKTERVRKPEAAEFLATESDETETEENTIEREVPEVQTENIQSFSAEVEEKLASMTLEEKIAQMFLTTPESLTQMEQVNIAGAGTRNAINEYPVGGLIYSNINYQGREQAGNLMFNAQEISNERIGLYLFLAVRMDAEDGTSAVGIADSYEPDALVEALAANRLDTEQEGVSMPVVFPRQDTDITVDAAWIMLDAAADVSVTGEENLPCALSGQCVQTVRGTGYEGVILTDSLSADNIKNTYSAGEAAVLAVQAGVDMIYCPENFPDAYQAVVDAVHAGDIAEVQINQAVGRILTKKYQIPMPAAPEQEEQVPEDSDAQQDVVEGEGEGEAPVE